MEKLCRYVYQFQQILKALRPETAPCFIFMCEHLYLVGSQCLLAEMKSFPNENSDYSIQENCTTSKCAKLNSSKPLPHPYPHTSLPMLAGSVNDILINPAAQS